MKALSTLTLALAIAAAGCGDSNPTPPTNNNPPPPSQTTTSSNQYTLDLKTGNERPNPITNAEQTASGTAVITIRITRDAANNIVSSAYDFSVGMQGFPAGSQVNIAHIHPGDQNGTGGIVVNTGLVAGDVVLTNGSGSFVKNNVVIQDIALAQAIVNNPSAYYFNVHSTLNPAGVLRAQMNNTGTAPDAGEPKPCDPADIYCIPG